MSTKILKPWGFETKLTDDSLPYTGKIAFTLANHRWSLQYHDQKTETITLISGQAKIQIGDSTQEMVLHHGYTITPGTIHRFIAVTDCVTIEVSTPETGNTFRLEDDYSRPNETEVVRQQPNRGWSTTL